MKTPDLADISTLLPGIEISDNEGNTIIVNKVLEDGKAIETNGGWIYSQFDVDIGIKNKGWHIIYS